MRALSCVAAVAVLAGTLAACASPYYSGYPRYGYAYQSYSSPGMTVTYTTGPAYAYSYPSYSSYPGYTYPSTYNSAGWDYYRNYHGIHPGPEYYP